MDAEQFRLAVRGDGHGEEGAFPGLQVLDVRAAGDWARLVRIRSGSAPRLSSRRGLHAATPAGHVSLLTGAGAGVTTGGCRPL
ncbi:hypothetical protein MOPEL_130_01450 [Mobilicoccus pelagius NBRC 104925]|uniref:Uncharacterized protein n=1 Tax=Mobilicoccus pelagius NBRC 104925 TaxID=1089455 RepID=H5UUY0_9MICO|nr:hypothetical protein MOPEL_130_01450 [Mobilicoccus pelagius NBRC 104925]